MATSLLDREQTEQDKRNEELRVTQQTVGQSKFPALAISILCYCQYEESFDSNQKHNTYYWGCARSLITYGLVTEKGKLTERGEKYFEMLQAVPLPIQNKNWFDPRKPSE